MPRSITSIVRCQLVREEAPDYLQNVTLSNPQQVADLFRKHFGDPDREYFVALYLTTKNQIAAISTVSIGSIDRTIVSPIEIFRPAFLVGTAALILIHNHPSGDPAPSPDDYLFTKNVVLVGKILGMPVLDHVIVSHNTHFSISREKPEWFGDFENKGGDTL